MQQIDLNYIDKIRITFNNIVRMANPYTQFRIILTSKRNKIMICCLLFYFFIKWQKNKRKIKKFYQKTDENKNLLKSLSYLLNNYYPTWFLPTAMSQMIYSNIKSKENFFVKFEKQVFILKDKGEMNVEWFPPNYNTLDSPIIAFVLGAVGNSTDRYVKEYAKIIQQNGLRLAILNRRGYDFRQLKTPKFIDKNECEDFLEILCLIKEIYNCPIYLCGVSAGSNHAAKLLGLYGKKVPVDAFVSISNPYNITRLSFNLRHDWYKKLVSQVIAHNVKKLYKFHSQTPNLKKRCEAFNNDFDQFQDQFKKSTDLWQIDKNMTIKISGHQNVIDYYYDISCERVLDKIEVPSLFINCLEDIVCYKENIPIDILYYNPNIILLITERGGHIEYLSGKDTKWWAFEVSIAFFKYFQNKTKNQIQQKLNNFLNSVKINNLNYEIYFAYCNICSDQFIIQKKAYLCTRDY